MSAGASPLNVGSARAARIGTEGGSVAALQSGDPADSPVLLVPGFTGSKEDFGPVLDQIAGAGCFVTAIDLPGQFESPGPDDPAGYAPDRLAAAVLAVAAQIGAGRPVRVVGHSYGGLVCRAAVIAAPTTFASIVLMGSGPARIGDQRRELLELMEPVLDSSGIEGVYEATLLLDAAEPGYVPLPDDLAAFLRRRFLAGSVAMLRGMADGLRHEPDRVDELAATGVRALVMHGVDDVPWPVQQQHSMAERLGARYTVIEQAAHSPAVENPAATVAALLEFWAG